MAKKLERTKVRLGDIPVGEIAFHDWEVISQSATETWLESSEGEQAVRSPDTIINNVRIVDAESR